jgi:hypothetical protein
MKMKNTIALMVAFGLLCGFGLPYVPQGENDNSNRCASVLPTHPRHEAALS